MFLKFIHGNSQVIYNWNLTVAFEPNFWKCMSPDTCCGTWGKPILPLLDSTSFKLTLAVTQLDTVCVINLNVKQL